MMNTGQIIVSTLIIVSVLLISGCINSQHYNKDNISFDYPANWKAGYIYDLPGAMVDISESSQVDVKIFKYNTSTDSSLKEVYYQSVKNRSTNLAKYCYQQVSDKTMNVDGSTAYELIYHIGCNSTQTRQKIREVWLEKKGYIYIIICTVIPPEDFPSKNIAFEEIITSFHVN
jgi:hypothetical protein